MSVSRRDRQYMRRIGAYKALSRSEEEAEHLSLPLEERLRRSWILYLRYRRSVGPGGSDDGPGAFYGRARALGLYRP